MSKKNYYAVRVGRKCGVFNTWDECRKSVNGYSGAVFKGFATFEEAAEFLRGNAPEKAMQPGVKNCGTYAYVDGSFNPESGVYGYGVCLFHDGAMHEFSGYGCDPAWVSMRNVAGEIHGVMNAINALLRLDPSADEIVIYYDYTGIEMWATHSWRANKPGTAMYVRFMDEVRKNVSVSFVHTAAHTGIELNERADALAKAAVGI